MLAEKKKKGMPEYEHERHGSIEVAPHVMMLIEKDRSEAVPQRTPAWYEKRRRHLTASQIASACGENPYESRMACIKRKVGVEPPFLGNSATEHGNRYEAEAVLKYEQLTGAKVIEFGLLESINEAEGFLAGSPDGITADGRLIEVKCPFRRKPNGEVPSHYVHQIQTLMHILRLASCDFIEYVPAGTWAEEVFQVVTVPRSDLWWAVKFPLMQRFWSNVLELRAAGGGLEEEAEEKEKPLPRRRRRELTITECLIEPAEAAEPAGQWLLPSGFLAGVASRVKEIDPQ